MRAKTWETRVLWNVGHGMNDIYWFMLPSLLPVILLQFDLRYGAAGGMLTAFLGTIAVFSLVLGKLSDSVPRRVVIGLGFVAASALLIGASLAPTLRIFLAFLLAAGVGVSAFHPVSYASIEESAPERPGRTYGMFEFWGSAAVFLMFLVHGLLLARLHWKTILLVTSIPGLVIGALYLLAFRLAASMPAASMPAPAARTKTATATRCDGAAPASEPGGRSAVLLFVLFLVLVILRFLGTIAVVNFTPTYLVHQVGLSPSIASFATGVYFLGGLAFTPFAGRLCDTRGPFAILLAATGVAFPVIFLIGLGRPVWLLPVLFLVLGAAYYGAGPAMNMITARMASRMGRGEAFGYLMAAVAVTFSFSPLLFGLFADAVGLPAAVRSFSLPVLASFVLLVLLMLLMRKAGTGRAPAAGS